jgi:hypothetical protein
MISTLRLLGRRDNRAIRNLRLFFRRRRKATRFSESVLSVFNYLRRD